MQRVGGVQTIRHWVQWQKPCTLIEMTSKKYLFEHFLAPGASWHALGCSWSLLGCSGTLLEPPRTLCHGSGASWDALGRSWSLLQAAPSCGSYVLSALIRAAASKSCVLCRLILIKVPNPCTLALNSYLGCSWLCSGGLGQILQNDSLHKTYQKHSPGSVLRAFSRQSCVLAHGKNLRARVHGFWICRKLCTLIVICRK